MNTRPDNLGAGLLLSILCACAPVDVKEFTLQPSANNRGAACTDQIASMVADISVVADRETAKATKGAPTATKIEEIYSQYEAQKGNILQSLRQSPVIETIFRSAELSSAKGINQQHRFLAVNAGETLNSALLRKKINTNPDRITTLDPVTTLDNYETDFIDRIPPPNTLNNRDFRTFINEYSEQMLRHTGSEPLPTASSEDTKNAGDGDDAFWNDLSAYYSAYAKGNFVDYFGNKYAKPDISLTVTDAELGNSVALFIEMIFDTSAHTPIWQSVDPKDPKQTTYYPGGTTNEPTGLVLKHLVSENISTNPRCGITIEKADVINMLSQNFASAASNVAGGAVGTIGGFGVSLGFFGKASVGDNKAVTSLVQAVVSELVKRLTVETTYRLLGAVSTTDKPSASQLTQFFKSSNNGQTPSHNAWVP
jgi:hypothetical protein